MRTKRILITGASGFIGSFLVEKALEEGYETWAGVRKSSSREYLKDDRIQFFCGHYVRLRAAYAAHFYGWGHLLC